MAAFTPFQISSSTSTGLSISIVSGSTTSTVIGSIDATDTYMPSLLCTNFGPNKAWIRLSSETSPVALVTDHLMLGNTVQLFTNPVPTGLVHIGVMVSVTTSPNTLYVTPGQGGI